jgi:predicted MFS family arabinose efflux permease
LRLSRLILLYFIVATVRAANAVFIVSLALTYPELSVTAIGQLLAAYSIVEALSGFLSGVIYELLGSRITLLISSAILAISYTAMNTTSSFSELIMFNALAGLSASMILVSSLSAIAEGTVGISASRRIFGVGGFEASNLGGYAVGFALAGFLELLGMLRGFIVSIILAFMSLIASVFITPIVPGAGIGYKIHHVDRRSLVLIPMWFGLATILGVGFLSPNILRKLNLGISLPFQISNVDNYRGALENIGSNPSIGLLLIIALLGVSIGLMIGSLLSTIIGKERMLVLGSLSFPIALVTVGFTYENLLLFLPLIIVITIPALSIPPTLLTFLADYTDESRRRGPASGIYVTVLGIGIGVGELLGGKIFDTYGLKTLTVTLAILFLLLSIPTLIYVNRYKSNQTSSRKR